MNKPALPGDHAALSAPQPTDPVPPSAPFVGGTPGVVVTPDGVVPGVVPEHVSPEAEQYLRGQQRRDEAADEEAVALAGPEAEAGHEPDADQTEEDLVMEEQPRKQDQAAVYRLAQAMVALFSVVLLVLGFLMIIDVISGVPRLVRFVVLSLGLGGLALMFLPRLTQSVSNMQDHGKTNRED